MNRIRRLLSLWTATAALVFGIALPAGAQTTTKYATTSVRLRAAASTQAAILATIPRGSVVRVGECAVDWCEVRYRGASGYAAERYLSEARTALRTDWRSGGGSGYVNSRGQWVPSPRYSPSGPPAGASARCRDGTYSFSRSRRGTCSHHGGVARWL